MDSKGYFLDKKKQSAFYSSNGAYLAEQEGNAPGIEPPALFNTMQLKEDEDSDIKENVATGAGGVNTAGNIIGGVMEKVMGAVDKSFKVAADLQKQAAIAQKTAQTKAAFAKQALKNAGSGRSAKKAKFAKKAVKQANDAKIVAELKAAKAANATAEANRLFDLAPKFAKLLKKLPMDQIGFGAAFISKALTSHNQTTLGKGIDATATAGLDLVVGKINPFIAAADAIIGLIPGGVIEKITGYKDISGDRINISNTMSDSVSSITSVGEGILTGDTRGMESFYKDSMQGKNTLFFQKAAEIGTEYGKHSEDRVQTVGDFWGGADSMAGRTTAFLSALPGIGDVGEGIGYGMFKAVEGVESIADSINESGRTLDPRKVDWSNPLGLW